MMAIVVDASVAAAWCFPDERAAAAERALEELPSAGGVVPDLFWHEIRNVLVVNERRRRIDREGSDRFMTRLRDMRMETDRDYAGGAVMALARRHRLTAYDAAYLETALRRGGKLATQDRDLAKAADAEGVAFSQSG